jgi:hypothetical protein
MCNAMTDPGRYLCDSNAAHYHDQTRFAMVDISQFLAVPAC